MQDSDGSFFLFWAFVMKIQARPPHTYIHEKEQCQEEKEKKNKSISPRHHVALQIPQRSSSALALDSFVQSSFFLVPHMSKYLQVISTLKESSNIEKQIGFYVCVRFVR